MPGLESNLTIVFFVVVAIAVCAALGWAAWKPLLSRAWRYLVIWWERDKLAEAEARRQHNERKLAEKELREACNPCLDTAGEDSAETPVTSREQMEPQQQKLRR